MATILACPESILACHVMTNILALLGSPGYSDDGEGEGGELPEDVAHPQLGEVAVEALAGVEVECARHHGRRLRRHVRCVCRLRWRPAGLLAEEEEEKGPGEMGEMGDGEGMLGNIQ